jgi:Zn-dependent peptidase ImmA (M78 family)
MGRIVFNIEKKKEIAIKTLKWCKKNLGINKRKKAPKVIVRVRYIDPQERVYGEYYFKENKIIVYSDQNKTIPELIGTIIHEYTHYLQSMKKYFDYFQTHYYSTHPFEKEAVKNSKQYTRRCLYEIKKSV